MTKLFSYVNGELKQIHSIVENVKNSEERRERYTTWQEMIEFEKEEVICYSIKAHIRSLRKFNISEEQILESIIQEFQIPAAEAEEFMKGQ